MGSAKPLRRVDIGAGEDIVRMRLIWILMGTLYFYAMTPELWKVR